MLKHFVRACLWPFTGRQFPLTAQTQRIPLHDTTSSETNLSISNPPSPHLNWNKAKQDRQQMLWPPPTQWVEEGDVVVQLPVTASMKSMHLLQLPLCVGEPRLLQLEQLPQLVFGEVPETPNVNSSCLVKYLKHPMSTPGQQLMFGEIPETPNVNTRSTARVWWNTWNTQCQHLVNSSKHPHLVNSSKHSHLVYCSKHPHLVNSSKHSHLVNSSKHPHLVNSSKHSHLVNSSKHPHLVNSSCLVKYLQHPHLATAPNIHTWSTACVSCNTSNIQHQLLVNSPCLVKSLATAFFFPFFKNHAAKKRGKKKGWGRGGWGRWRRKEKWAINQRFEPSLDVA